MPTLHVACGVLRSAFAIAEVAEALGCDEQTTRRLLNAAGAEPRFDEEAINPRERVPRPAVAALARLGGEVGKCAILLLRPEGPPPGGAEQ